MWQILCVVKPRFFFPSWNSKTYYLSVEFFESRLYLRESVINKGLGSNNNYNLNCQAGYWPICPINNCLIWHGLLFTIWIWETSYLKLPYCQTALVSNCPSALGTIFLYHCTFYSIWLSVFSLQISTSYKKKVFLNNKSYWKLNGQLSLIFHIYEPWHHVCGLIGCKRCNLPPTLSDVRQPALDGCPANYFINLMGLGPMGLGP